MATGGPTGEEQRTADAVNDYLGMVARHRRGRWLAEPERKSIPFAEFRQMVRRYRPSTLLPALASLTLALGEPPFTLPQLSSAPPWAVALAARESILWGNEYRKDVVTGDDLRRLFNAHNNIHDRPDVDASGALGILTRIVYEQFPYQESLFEEVSRTHAMLVQGVEDVELEVLGDPHSWEDLLGGPLGEVVGATFFLQVAANENAGWFDQGWLDRDDLQDIYDQWPRAVIERRAADLASTFAEFKAAYESAPKPPSGFDRYTYNPLIARPFVHMPDGRLLAPQPRLILRTVSPGGLYYQGIARFGTAFSRDLGRLTERYVGELLAATDHDVEMHPEVTYGKPEVKSVDWFLVLPTVVVMFEVKSARYGLLDRAAVEGFEERTKALLDKATKQLERTSAAIDDGVPQFAHLPPDRPRIGIIVTGEPYYLANSPWIRDLIEEAPFPTLTASLRDVEHLCTLPLTEIEEQLVAIANDSERSTWNLGNALQSVSERSASPILQRAWDAYPWPTALDADDEPED